MPKISLEIATVLRKVPTDGAAAVLVGVDAAPTVLSDIRAAWLPHEHGNFRQAVKAVSAALDGRSWHWPWFDFCLESFSERKVWPDGVLGWDSFEPVKPEPRPKTPDDSLSWLSLKEVRAILRTEGVKAASAKRADIYNALYRHVPFDKWRDVALANWDSDNKAGPDMDGRAHVKLELLTHTLSIANYSAMRAAQIGGSIDGWPPGSRVNIEMSDKAAMLMYRSPSPDQPLPGLPPFYPGDGSYLRIDFGRRVKSPI